MVANSDVRCWPIESDFIMVSAMKLLRIFPRDRRRLYGAIIKKQAEIRRSGR
jgi:hypothetical protein